VNWFGTLSQDLKKTLPGHNLTIIRSVFNCFFFFDKIMLGVKVFGRAWHAWAGHLQEPQLSRSPLPQRGNE